MPDEQEPPIREFADRGTLWLLESPQNLRDLMGLVARELADRLDFSRAERINRSFVPGDLHKQEADILYRVPFPGGAGEVWVYVLLEHQSRPKRLIALSLLSYMVQAWETQCRGWEDAKTPRAQRRLAPIIPIVFYTGKRRWPSPLSLGPAMDVPPELARFVPRHDVLFVNVRGMPPDALTGSAVACALRVLQAEDAPLDGLERVLRDAVACLEALPAEQEAEWRRAMHYVLLLIRHRREPAERAGLCDVVTESVSRGRRQVVRGMTMTDAQVLVAQGRTEGRTEGRIEGRVEMALELLEAKFGSLSPEVMAAVGALTPRRLKALARRILTAQTLADLHLPEPAP